MNVPDYVRDVIGRGDEGSSLLRAMTAHTLEGKEHVEIIGGGPVLRVPEGQSVVAVTLGGRAHHRDPYEHASSAVRKVGRAIHNVGAQPILISSIVDTSDSDTGRLEEIALGLNHGANIYRLANFGGENAVMGARVRSEGNVAVTGVGIIPTDILERKVDGPMFVQDGVVYAHFDPRGHAVSINSDGTGTKVELYERAGNFAPAVDDFLAMNLDDAVKRGAEAQIVTGVVETMGGNVPVNEILKRAYDRGLQIGFSGIMQHEKVGKRIASFKASNRAYNLVGSVISTIDEDRLENPLQSQPGEYLMAIQGKPNPRSNGISTLRKIMENEYGSDWHERDDCTWLLEYLTTPSTILYASFSQLIERGLASNVYHMSGGAYNGKLAVPLAEQELFAALGEEGHELPELPLAVKHMAELGRDKYGVSTGAAYAQSPMGIDGFISVAEENINLVKMLLNEHRLRGTVVAQLQPATSTQSGVQFEGYDGTPIEFSGRAKPVEDIKLRAGDMVYGNGEVAILGRDD